jgi:N-methylhydantoinase A/oxoprolinase/acetone carboxylase beta subunit
MINFFKKQKKEPQNLEEILAQFKDLKEDFERISAELESLRKKNKFNVQKIGLVRFNPFRGIGGDQSFSLAILDGNDSGAVITSLYNREESRVYGKPVRAGRSEYLLSEEEKKAIEIARKQYEKNNSKTKRGEDERGEK